jgi:Cu2+-exporting ATPase
MSSVFNTKSTDPTDPSDAAQPDLALNSPRLIDAENKVVDVSLNIDMNVDVDVDVDVEDEQSTRLRFEIAHAIPGRLRLKVQNLKEDSIRASSCLMQLGRLRGVLEVRTNFACASAVIVYEPSVVDEEEVLLYLSRMRYATNGGYSDLPHRRGEPTIIGKAMRHMLNWLDESFPGAVQLAVGALAFGVAVARAPEIAVKVCLGLSVVPILNRATRTLVDEEKIGVDALDCMAATLMILNGRLVEAGFMTLLIALGEFIRERTAKRCEKIVNDLLGLSGRSAWLVKGKKRVCIPADEVKVGEVVAVYPGDMIPVDGTVISGEASIDQSKMTGEPIPVEVKTGDKVMAATVAVEGKIHIRCEATGSQTKAGMVLECIAHAPIHETKIQNYASVVADKMVVPIFFAAATCFLITRNHLRLMSMLIFDFSTGIRIAAPTAVLSSMHRAGRRGILIKSGQALEQLAAVDAIVFDKTGTLTSGEPKVLETISFNGKKSDDVLALAAGVEQRLHHPASRAIVKAAVLKGLTIPDRATSKFMRGMGVKATIDNIEVIVGSRRMMESENIDISESRAAEARALASGESIAYVAIEHQLAGLIRYSDQLRPETASAMQQLKRLGIKKLVMATGDGEGAAQRIAENCGITEVMARAFPEQKADLVKKLKADGFTVAVIGDGINDSPALAHADVAISLHGGTEAARHSANIVLTDDDLLRLPEAIKIARGAMGLVKQNLSLAVVPNSAGLALAAFGLVGPAGATLLNNGSAIAAALNSLRPLYVDSWSQAEPVDNDEPST